MKSRGLDYWRKEIRKKRFKYTILFVFTVSVLFLCFQAFYFKVITSDAISASPASHKVAVHSKLNVRGVKKTESVKYIPNEKGKFVCFKSKKVIDFKYVNDDYCDCPADGSDEPGTNACENALFYCEAESSKPEYVASSRVNDGICDCCDGSDEWAQLFFPFRISEDLQRKLGRYHSPCPNLCPDEV